MSIHEHRNFVFGLRNGKLVHVSEVANGLNCDCVCPHCTERLIAYNSLSNKKAQHFKHKSNIECQGYLETTIHYLAKEIIEEQGFIQLPDVSYFLSEAAREYRRVCTEPPAVTSVKANKVVFDKIELEKTDGSIKPDIKATIGEKILYIEIAVTHFVDDAKATKVKRLGTPLLEVDLSDLPREFGKKEISNALDDIGRMKWIFNPKAFQRYEEKRIVADAITNFVEGNIRRFKMYGRSKTIYECPLSKNKSVFYESDCDRCICLAGQLEAAYRMGDEPAYPENIVECIGHVNEQYQQLLKSHQIQPEEYTNYLKQYKMYGHLR
jgi:hypothetical protein